jgi:glycosyltransferase involved in cell wall biosynthesis
MFFQSINRMIEREVDILYSPTTVLNFYSLNIPSVVSVHDIQHEHMPEYFDLLTRIRRWAPYRATCARADAIQVSSNFIRRSIVNKYRFVHEDRIVLIPEGVSLERFDPDGIATRPTLVAQDLIPFLFYPAQLWPHKNHLLLIEALALARDRLGREVPCVLSGADKGMLGHITNRIEKLGLRKCLYVGLVPQEELLWLYKHCACVLALGIYESSCLPIKEAAVVRKPIIAADIEPNVELNESMSFLLFERNSPDSLAHRIVQIATNVYPSSDEIERNSAVVRSYSWNKLGEQYLQLFRRTYEKTIRP